MTTKDFNELRERVASLEETLDGVTRSISKLSKQGTDTIQTVARVSNEVAALKRDLNVLRNKTETLRYAGGSQYMSQGD